MKKSPIRSDAYFPKWKPALGNIACRSNRLVDHRNITPLYEALFWGLVLRSGINISREFTIDNARHEGAVRGLQSSAVEVFHCVPYKLSLRRNLSS